MQMMPLRPRSTRIIQKVIDMKTLNKRVAAIVHILGRNPYSDTGITDRLYSVESSFK